MPIRRLRYLWLFALLVGCQRVGGEAPEVIPAAEAAATAEELRRTKSSPLVRKIAEEHGIDIKQLEGTGMSGRVTKNDILSFIESGAPASQRSTAPSTATSQVAQTN